LSRDVGRISSFIKPDDRVLIKPNMAIASNPQEAVNTHPSVIEDVINAVK
jgi:uncharacterized protein (DUF362 family)